MTAVHDIIMSWLLVADPLKIRRETVYEGEESLAAAFRSSGEEVFAAQLETRDYASGSATIHPIEHSLAKALAEYVTLDPIHERFEAAEQALHYDNAVWLTFRERAVDLLQSNPSRLAALKDRLRCEPTLLLSTPRAVALHSHFAPDALAQHHASASVRDMWESSGVTDMHMTSDLEYRLLRLADPNGWVEILQGFTLPQPVFSLVDGGILDDITEIASLLTIAAPAFDQEGAWDRGVFLPFQLLTSAERVLEQKAVLTPEDIPADGTPFTVGVDAVVAALTGREDGTWLGYAWLQQLAWRDRVGRSWKASRSQNDSTAIWKLMSALAARLPPLTDPLGYIHNEEEIWRCDRLVASLLPIVLANSQSVARGVLESVVQDNLVATTEISGGLRRRKSVFMRTTAAALTEIEDPAAWLETMWQHSFAMRDRLRTWQGTTASKRLDPGAFAASCAAALLLRAAGDELRSAEAINLWGALTDIVVEATLTNVAEDATWVILARWLAISFADVHSSCELEERVKRLGSFLNPLRDTSVKFCELVSDLIDGGTAATEIAGALKGLRLDMLVQRTLSDATRLGGKGSDKAGSIAVLQELALKLR